MSKKNISDFSRNVLMLLTGTTVAQAIPIIISPILTRMYGPEDFGLLALFVAVSAVLSSIATARYELAIMLPTDDEDAINIAALGVFICCCFSIVLFIITVVFNVEIASLLGNEKIAVWLFFIPLVVLLTGSFNVFNFLNTRKKLYKDIAKAHVFKSIGLAALQLSIGAVKSGAAGLITGQVFSHFLSNLKLAKNAKKHYNLSAINISKLKALAIKYSNFPKFSMWAILANSIAYNLCNILISVYYSVTTLGFYSLAQKLLSMPSVVIGKSIGQVYFQQAVDEKNKTGRADKTFDKTSKKLFLISSIVFLPTYFVLPLVFEIVFGTDWKIAGDYAQATVPFVAMQFISSALSNTNNIFEKQRLALFFQLVLALVSIGCIILSNFLGMEFLSFLQFLSATLSTYYLILFFVLREVSKGKL